MSDNTFDINSLQEQLFQLLEQSISKSTFETFFSSVRIKTVTNDNTILFMTDTKKKKECLETQYLSLLKQLLKTITNNDFEVSFVVKDDDARNIVSTSGIHVDSSFDFLFEGDNNKFTEEYKDYIDNNDLDELCKQALGNDEYERQKTLHEKRKQKADFNEAGLNIPECVLCGSDHVPNVTLDIQLQPNIKQVISINIKIRASKCENCGEEYYDSEASELVREIRKLTETET